MYVTLDKVKKHLNIDNDFTEDDEYLEYLIEVAEEVVSKHIDRDLRDIVDGDGSIPGPLHHAILLFIGNMYDSRESNVYTSVQQLPHSFDYLLDLYQNY